MNSIFDTENREKIIQRIQNLNENNSAVWGKMNIYQMIKHCAYWESWIQGNGDFRFRRMSLMMPVAG